MTKLPLIANGRYWVPLSAIEYVAVPCTELQGVCFVLTPPPDTTYPDSAPILVGTDGALRTASSTLPITVEDLNYGGRVFDWSTGKTTQYRPPTGNHDDTADTDNMPV